MKRIGILFQADMVRAILDGRKTLTSRTRGLGKINERRDEWKYVGFDGVRHNFTRCAPEGVYVEHVRCPYGRAGDVLVGRETWMPSRSIPGRYYYRATLNAPSGHIDKWRPSIHMPFSASRLILPVVDSWPTRLHDMTGKMAIQEGIKSEILAANEDHPDCICYVTLPDDNHAYVTAVEAYAQLWDRINGKRRPGKPDVSWAANPWVWRVEFKSSGTL